MTTPTFQIVTDSSCDLSDAFLEGKNVHVVPFYVSFDDSIEYKEKVDLSLDDFYKRVIDNPTVFPKTSLPSVQDFYSAFVPYVEKGLPVICICISTKFSGSYNSARLAAEMIEDEYPDAKIAVIDSMVNTVLQGLVVLEATRMLDNRVDFDTAVASLNSIKETGRIIFTVGNTDYLRHGGRIGKLAGIATATLGIKPLILLQNGEIYPAGITRNRKRALNKMLEFTKDYFTKLNDDIRNYTFIIGYGDDLEEAENVRKELMSTIELPDYSPSVPLNKIGAAIAVHTGPYAIGIAFLRKYDAPAMQAATTATKLVTNTN